jgi:hypothetical protein
MATITSKHRNNPRGGVGVYIHIPLYGQTKFLGCGYRIEFRVWGIFLREKIPRGIDRLVIEWDGMGMDFDEIIRVLRAKGARRAAVVDLDVILIVGVEAGEVEAEIDRGPGPMFVGKIDSVYLV